MINKLFPVRTTIHPPIQGGNFPTTLAVSVSYDTPSHTGRKQYSDVSFWKDAAIHPPIQGGNTQCLCGFQPPQTPRCAICTNSIFSLLICHFFNVLADFYKKSFHPKYRKFYQYVFLKVLLHSPVHSSRCGSNFHPIRILSKHGPRHPK